MKKIQTNKINVLFLVFSVSIFFSTLSCNKESSNKKVSITEKLKQNKTNPKLVKDDKILKAIHSNELVIVVPSQKQLDSLQISMEEDEYTSFVDDSNFYINQAREYAENIHSTIVEVKSGEELVFLSEKGVKFPFDTRKLIWDIIVFNGKTKPEQIDVTNVQDEMIRVYNK